MILRFFDSDGAVTEESLGAVTEESLGAVAEESLGASTDSFEEAESWIERNVKNLKRNAKRK